MPTNTNNPQDNWTTFRQLLEQLLENLETQTDIVRSMIDEGAEADHLDFIDQLQFDPEPPAITLVDKKPSRRMAEARNRNRPWNSDDEQELRVLFKYGMTDAEIGEFVGRSIRAVENRRELLGLKRSL